MRLAHTGFLAVCVCLPRFVGGCLGGRSLEKCNLQVTVCDGSRLHSRADRFTWILGPDVTNW